MYLTIGLMSGTSMDGIDAALLCTDGESDITELGYFALRYDPRFKTLLHAAQYLIRKYHGDLDAAAAVYTHDGLQHYLLDVLGLPSADLTRMLTDCQTYMGVAGISLVAIIEHSTLLHAQAVNHLLQQMKYLASDITVIGYHGQTMYHQPSAGISVIVGDGQLLADTIGIPVINDFRCQDLQHGGQGAPFAPLYHHALVKRGDFIPAAVVNCGGIANMTLITNDDPLDLVGFDTGPGNGLLDRLVQQRTHGRLHMDKDGAYGLQGQIDANVLAALYRRAIKYPSGNFFDQLPPKALDIGDLQLIAELDALNLPDACATLAAFTADSIVHSLKFLISRPMPQTWILAGGGWHNPVIKQQLATRLSARLGAGVKLVTADDIGWHGQALEAQIFAYFAIRALQDKPLSVPGTTGVCKPVSGGKRYVPNTV